MTESLENMHPIDRLFWGFPLGSGRPDMPEDTPELRDDYRAALADIDVDELRKVVRRLIDTYETFPTIADVRAKHGELFLGEVKRDPAFEQALGRLQRSKFPESGYDIADWELVHAGVHARIKERLISRQLSYDVVRDDPNYVARECYRLITGIEVTKEEQP